MSIKPPLYGLAIPDYLFSSTESKEKTDELLNNSVRGNVCIEALSDVDLELLIASQTDELTRVTKGLANFLETALQQFLAINGAGADFDYTTLINRCADFLTFGAIEKCPKCESGDMMFMKHGYKCNGMESKISRCTNFMRTPKRSLCVIPLELRDNSFFSTCNLFVSHRAVRKKQLIEFDLRKTCGFEAFQSAEPENPLPLEKEAAVDQQSGKLEQAHVYEENGLVYSIVLAADEGENNSFYKLQVLQSDEGETYFWFVKTHGRIGAKGKKPKTFAFNSAEEACAAFEECFKRKTGNEWNSGKPFAKHPEMFHVTEVDVSVPHKLTKSVEDLMNVLFNDQSMEHAMHELGLDLNKMFESKLTEKRLRKAERVLSELSTEVNRKRSVSPAKLRKRFFALIPHHPVATQVLDTPKQISEKKDALKALMDMQVANEIMRRASSLNSAASYYAQLNAKIWPLDRDSEDFKIIERYASNTAFGQRFRIAEVFQVKRLGEKDMYADFDDFENRSLLWHGDGVTSFASIIANGLTIGSSTLRMFGKGIYFEDAICKALRNCKPDAFGTRLLVLCKVALGKMKEHKTGCRNGPCPAGFHSAKGLGEMHPNPEEAFISGDGSTVPLGQLVASNVNFQDVESERFSPLKFNEYAVFDENQVSIKYLVQLKRSNRPME